MLFLLLPSFEDEELEEYEAKVAEVEKLDTESESADGSDGDLTEVADSFLTVVFLDAV